MRRKEGREGQRVEKRRSSVRAGSRARDARDATSQSGDYKNSPLETRCLLFATLRLVQTSLPRFPVGKTAGSPGEQVIEMFF